MSEEQAVVEGVYPAWGKTPRFGAGRMVVTEKIDGTNGLISIDVDGPGLRAGSRNRWLDPTQPKADNYGFAAWCEANKDELVKLGRGRYYGEWWGCGIGKRGYHASARFFSLFNTARPAETLPSCVLQVPVLYAGAYDPRGPGSMLGGPARER